MAVVRRAAPGFDVAVKGIKREGGMIFRCNFEKRAVCLSLCRLYLERGQQGASGAMAAMIRINRKRQQFRFACNRAPQGETMRQGAKKAKRRGQKGIECHCGKRFRHRETARMQIGQRLRRHGRITGGASRGGAASARRTYSGAGRPGCRPCCDRISAIRAMARPTSDGRTSSDCA